MKVMILLVVLAVAVSARPQLKMKETVIPILFMSDERDASGQFSLSYVSGDGTEVMERGILKPTPDGKDYVLVKEGAVSFITPEGLKISQTYVADELGFRTEGAHLPTA